MVTTHSAPGSPGSIAAPAPAPAPAPVSTGHLPGPDVVNSLLETAHARFAPVTDGAVADYIPALACASPSLFGLCVVDVDGSVYRAGDTGHEFSIQSVAKPFVFALVAQVIGVDEARRQLGVNNSGLAFNSVLAIELNADRTANPMVNAGAIATTSLVPGSDAAARWAFIHEGLSRFAGHSLALDEEVYASESATNLRNRGIAQLLDGYGRMYSDPVEATDLYTRTCSLLITVEDLAVMSATLADGGVNPVTGEQVVDPLVCKRTLAVLATAGLYERSGEWLYDVGLPAKSGVSGAIMTVAPGKGGLATFSPPLDEAGNSVRGRLAAQFLSDALGLNIFASVPVEPSAGRPRVG
ncbi:L-glutaminase [Sanguibacter gelidistatuariae]|uniref:Glutaminase n=1 Tax=Sanguibacter gelidistatuariae TaxID=1814289 RepID=A0A1G6N7E3_9MICO|nr:glutaminase A [Sanguibacter gelidistatuariae]SDC63055.1 L-glutaminase [Sanguibacter gelidistatuariae]